MESSAGEELFDMICRGKEKKIKQTYIHIIIYSLK
jgi:hypothetical protein